jgi:hypothetical protein
LLQKPKIVGDKEKSLTAPKKFVAFSHRDSLSIENKYQELFEGRATAAEARSDVKVPVGEDLLFDVDIVKRELVPAYWLGPIFEGTHSIPDERSAQ